MRKLPGIAALLCLLCLSACRTTVSTREPTTVLRYQHVANVHEIRFSTPIRLPGRSEPVAFVTPRDAHGFWAVFLICSIDSRASVLPGFRYNLNHLRVRYGHQLFGPAPPYTVRYEGAADLNGPADAPLLESAIASEIDEGPVSTAFGRSVYADLNFRVAIFVPRALPDYAGGELALQYTGQPAILLGNGHPPSDIPAAGGNGAGITATCLP
jgi:hypothetical protein